LTAEYGITQTVIDFYTSEAVFLYIFFCSCNGFFDCLSVEAEIYIWFNSWTWRVAYNTFLCIVAFFAYVATFYKRYDREIEMFCKCIVTAVVSRHSHDGSSSVACKYVVAHPDRYRFSCERICCVASSEHACDFFVNHTFTFRTLFCLFKIFINCLFLFWCSYRCYELAFRCKYHESYSEHGIGACREYCKLCVAVFYLESYFCSF